MVKSNPKPSGLSTTDVSHPRPNASDTPPMPQRTSPPAARTLLVRTLYEAHHLKLTAFLTRLVGPDRASDVMQEVFFSLLRVDNLERRDITVSYLYRVGENLVRKGYHRDRRFREVLEDLRSTTTDEEDRGSKGVRGAVQTVYSRRVAWSGHGHSDEQRAIGHQVDCVSGIESSTSGSLAWSECHNHHQLETPWRQETQRTSSN